MRQETAEQIAQEALIWLANEDDLLPIFLGATGAASNDIRSAAQDLVFLGSVLEFLLMDDAWIIRFCDATGHPPTRLQEARYALPGGKDVHWT